MITVNGRLMNVPLTGIQRYISEIMINLPQETFRTLTPPAGLGSAAGLAWEQIAIPPRVGKTLLWSPCNTGPLAISHQVLTVHDIATMEGAETDSRPYRAAYYKWLFHRLLPRVSGILTVSEFTRQRLIDVFGLNPQNIHVTHLGVDHSRFTPPASSQVDALKSCMNITGPYILFLGALSARKNMARLVEAWRAAQSSIPAEMQLVIAGGAGIASAFDGQSLPLLPPRVKLLGRIDDQDLPTLLGGATAFVFPSLYEGFGLPPLEAMACGTPCIVSNITSMPEVTGTAALHVDPYDVNAIGAAIVRLLNDTSLRASLTQAGLTHARIFQWGTTAHKTLGILRHYCD